MIGIPLTMGTPSLPSPLETVAQNDQHVMKCNFMLEQLTSLDQKIHRLVSDLNHVYLTQKQAQDLKIRWKRQEIATQRLKQSIAKQLQEQQKSLYQQIDELTKEVRQLRKQQREVSKTNAQKLHQLQQLQQQYHHENKVNISYQKQLNRSIQLSQIIEMKMQQQVLQEQNVLRQEEEMSQRSRQKSLQSTLVKKYEQLIKKKSQLIAKKEDDQNSLKQKLKNQLNKLVRMQEHIIEEDACFNQMEKSIAQQKIIIQQLKAEEGIEEEKPLKAQRQIELMKLKSRNYYIDKYFQGSDIKQFQINIPNYVNPINKQKNNKMPSMEKVPFRKYTKISRQRLPSIRIMSNEKRNQKTINRSIESSIELKRRKLPGRDRTISIKKSVDVNAQEKQKQERQLEDKQSNSSDDNIFRPVRIVKQIVVQPKKQPIKEQESEQQQPQRVFVKPIVERNSNPQPRQIQKNKKSKTESIQEFNVLMEPQYRNYRTAISAVRPEIDLVAEKRLHFDTDSLESEIEEIKPVTVAKPAVRIQSKLSHKLESTATDVYNSFAVGKKTKNKGRNHGRGISFQTQGYQKESSENGSFRISANSLMFGQGSIKYSQLGHIPEYAAEELGLSQS